MNEILRAPLGQVPYAIWGWGLMIFKYAVEFGVIYAFAGTIYTPWAFLLPFITVKASAFGPQPTWLGAFVLLWSLPFVAIAIILSSRRCIDAGRSAWDGLLVLCPLVNLVFMVAMCFVPASPKRPEYSDQEVSSSRSSSAMAAVISIALGLLPGAAMLILGVYVLRDYGAGLFFVAPIVMRSEEHTSELQSQ